MYKYDIIKYYTGIVKVGIGNMCILYRMYETQMHLAPLIQQMMRISLFLRSDILRFLKFIAFQL